MIHIKFKLFTASPTVIEEPYIYGLKIVPPEPKGVFSMSGGSLTEMKETA